MNKKLELKNFELKKVKFNAKKGLEIDWFDLNQCNDLYSVDSDSKPSDDYVTALNPLTSDDKSNSSFNNLLVCFLLLFSYFINFSFKFNTICS